MALNAQYWGRFRLAPFLPFFRAFCRQCLGKCFDLYSRGCIRGSALGRMYWRSFALVRFQAGASRNNMLSRPGQGGAYAALGCWGLASLLLAVEACAEFTMKS